MEKRFPKKNDQEMTEEAYQLTLKLIEDHPEIERSLWMGAFFSCIANAHKNENCSYKEFKSIINDIVRFYKSWWEQET